MKNVVKILIIYNLTLNDQKKVCNSCIIYIALLIITSTTVANTLGDYDEKYMKIKFNSDDR